MPKACASLSGSTLVWYACVCDAHAIQEGEKSSDAAVLIWVLVHDRRYTMLLACTDDMCCDSVSLFCYLANSACQGATCFEHSTRLLKCWRLSYLGHRQSNVIADTCNVV